jgi:hypothetical protein
VPLPAGKMEGAAFVPFSRFLESIMPTWWFHPLRIVPEKAGAFFVPSVAKLVTNVHRENLWLLAGCEICALEIHRR